MKKQISPLFYFFTSVMLLFFSRSIAQQLSVQDLGQKTFELNNRFLYDSSLIILNQRLMNSESTEDDKFYCCLYKSYTYKRLFDYPSTHKYLDEAYTHAILSEHKDKYTAIILSERAYAYFDVQAYKKADSIMHILANNRYAYIDSASIARLQMQKGYLLFLEKKYTAAEKTYDQAIAMMQKTTAYDLPMILGKKIELYGAMNELDKMKMAYDMAMQYADSFKIYKYQLYANECMILGNIKLRDIDNLVLYYKKFDSLKTHYDQIEQLKNIDALEKKYNITLKEKQLQLQKTEIKASKFQNIVLIFLLLGLLLSIIVFLILKNRADIKKEIIKQEEYTKNLFENIENERKRIAIDLHDGINHELLNLKNKSYIGKKIETIEVEKVIEEVRQVSRNLYPAMFETIGLQASIEALCNKICNETNLYVSSEIMYDKNLNIIAELQVYRIIQESLQNTLKHANALAAIIKLSVKNKEIHLEIKDNGKGFDVQNQLNNMYSFGLKSIEQRVKAISGTYQITSNNKGTTLSIIIPYTKN